MDHPRWPQGLGVWPNSLFSFLGMVRWTKNKFLSNQNPCHVPKSPGTKHKYTAQRGKLGTTSEVFRNWLIVYFHSLYLVFICSPFDAFLPGSECLLWQNLTFIVAIEICRSNLPARKLLGGCSWLTASRCCPFRSAHTETTVSPGCSKPMADHRKH